MKKLWVMITGFILIITGLVIWVVVNAEMSKMLETEEYEQEEYQKYHRYREIGGFISFIGFLIFIFGFIIPYYWKKKQHQQNTQQTQPSLDKSNQMR